MGQVILEETRETLGQDVRLALPVEDADTPLISEEELRRMEGVVRKLHERVGHPTNRSLVNMLKSRGADQRYLQLASEHHCDDCKEVRLPKPHTNVSLHGCETLWHTLLLMIDEASRFAVAHELYRHPKTEQRNPTF